jgi:hypothetical protein
VYKPAYRATLYISYEKIKGRKIFFLQNRICNLVLGVVNKIYTHKILTGYQSCQLVKKLPTFQVFNPDGNQNVKIGKGMVPETSEIFK